MEFGTKPKKVMTETRTRDIADEVVRRAIREQARDLEKHLQNIHERLSRLERVTKP